MTSILDYPPKWSEEWVDWQKSVPQPAPPARRLYGPETWVLKENAPAWVVKEFAELVARARAVNDFGGVMLPPSREPGAPR